VLLELNSGFESWNFSRGDVLKFHIGHLPALVGDPSMPIVAPLIAECADFGGLRRAWIVQGEKWCTARRTAQRTVDIVAKRCGLVVAESVSSRKVLYSRSAGLANAVPVTTAPASQLSDVLADQDELLVYCRTCCCAGRTLVPGGIRARRSWTEYPDWRQVNWDGNRMRGKETLTLFTDTIRFLIIK